MKSFCLCYCLAVATQLRIGTENKMCKGAIHIHTYDDGHPVDERNRPTCSDVKISVRVSTPGRLAP
jgi:hypothetical protein